MSRRKKIYIYKIENSKFACIRLFGVYLLKLIILFVGTVIILVQDAEFSLHFLHDNGKCFCIKLERIHSVGWIYIFNVKWAFGKIGYFYFFIQENTAKAHQCSSSSYIWLLVRLHDVQPKYFKNFFQCKSGEKCFYIEIMLLLLPEKEKKEKFIFAFYGLRLMNSHQVLEQSVNVRNVC